MNRHQRRNQNKERYSKAKELMKQPESTFESIDLTKRDFIPKGMTRAYANNRYVVMVYDSSPTTKGNAIRVMIQKHDNTPIVNHWKEIQMLKNEIFGKETTAIEYFPSESELIDDYNIYWIWIFENDILPIPII